MKSFLPVLLTCASCALFFACGSDSSSSPSGDSSSSQNPNSSSSVIGGGGGGVVGPLPGTANLAYTQNLYLIWKAFHYTTIEEESTKYPNFASGNFDELFAGKSAARVIWSNSSISEACKIEEANGSPMYRRGCTVSEGIGYGMLITVFQEDFEAFNRLWTYSYEYRNSVYSSGRGLMPWLTSSFSWDVIDESSATDADLDIATSLIIAYYKTGNALYLEDAKALAGSIWEHEINKSNNLIYSGDTPMWKSSDPTYNLSYFSPVALRLFAMIDPEHDWNKVIDASYAYMKKVQDAGTGVFPDWSNGDGVAVDPNNGSAKNTYWTFNKESVRIPWRIAWDYYWFQDERAGEILNKLNNFIAEKSANDPSSNALATNYSWDLAIGADNKGAAVPTQWLGAWCLTGMAGAQDWLDRCTALFNEKDMTTSASSYFSNILQMMYSQLLNGLYSKPF